MYCSIINRSSVDYRFLERRNNRAGKNHEGRTGPILFYDNAKRVSTKSIVNVCHYRMFLPTNPIVLISSLADFRFTEKQTLECPATFLNKQRRLMMCRQKDQWYLNISIPSPWLFINKGLRILRYMGMAGLGTDSNKGEYQTIAFYTWR